jgi:hypothetical protein
MATHDGLLEAVAKGRSQIVLPTRLWLPPAVHALTQPFLRPPALVPPSVVCQLLRPSSCRSLSLRRSQRLRLCFRECHVDFRMLKIRSWRWRRSLEVAFRTLGRNRARARLREGEGDVSEIALYDAVVVDDLRSCGQRKLM